MLSVTENLKTMRQFQEHGSRSFEMDRYEFLQNNVQQNDGVNDDGASCSDSQKASDLTSLSTELAKVSLESKQTASTATMVEKMEKFNRFAPFYLDDASSDCTFSIGPEKIPAHKIVLASCSPVFKAMFFGSLPEQNDIRIVDVSTDGFKEFLEYFYHDDIDVTKHKCIVEVMYLAEKYEVAGYLGAILPFLMTTDPMVCLELVAKCEFPELQEILKQMIIDNHTEFFESETFVQYDANILKMILTWDELKVYSEEIFMACYRWTEYAWKQQQKQQKQLKEEDDENETIVDIEPTPADIRAKMNGFFDLIEISSMKSRTLVTNLVKFADFFTKSDLMMIHKVLADKYPVALDNLVKRMCDLNVEKQVHFIRKIESITFESSKELFFIDYFLPNVNSFAGINMFYPHIMTLSKKSLAEQEKDIVLMRKIVRSSFATRSSDDETIKIQPNTKYEIRIIISNFTSAQKWCVPMVYTSNVCDFGPDEKITIDGHSIISKLQFKSSN